MEQEIMIKIFSERHGPDSCIQNFDQKIKF